MKKIYKILFIISLAFVVSCDDYLYKEPIGLLTPDQINLEPTVTSVQYAVNSSYQLLSSTLNIIGEWGWDDGIVLRNDFILQDIASDDMQKKWNPDGDQAWMDEVDNFNFTASNGGFNGLWAYDYEGISRANTAISYLTNSEIIEKIGIEESLKNRLLGEVYFLRAFYYFDLVVNFGDVPQILEPLKDFYEAYEVATRISKETILERIALDLSEAQTLLPDSKYSDNTERWRVSLGAVIAMQAKVSLFLEEWQEVIDYVDELETLGFYDLNDHYFDNFSIEKEFIEDEVIFAYDHQEATTPRRGNGICALAGWGFIAPTDDFINTFEANDPRLPYTVNVDDQAVYKIFGDTTTANKGYDDAASNKIYIRWADVLLWKAEAYNERGSYPEAIAIVNSIRARARTTPYIDGSLPPAGTLPDRNTSSTDKAEIKDWIIHERRVELGFESHRFNDLKRWGIAGEVLVAHGKNFQDFNYLYPIPQGEIDKSGGTITQNTGY